MPVRSMLVKLLFSCLSMITWYNKCSNMRELPSISILVMSHNQEAFIADTVNSVLSQKYDGELEFIFCDDHSTDSTFEIIQKIVSEYEGNHRVVTHRCEINGRVATNMNVAVSLAKCNWYMRVDGDDILHPDRVRLTALAIMKHPGATAISGRLIPFESYYQETKNQDDNELSFNVFSIKDFTPTREPEGLEWWGCMMTIHRSVFDVFGPLPSECNVLDDTMFATRALMLGNFVIIVNGYLLYYRRHSGNISSSKLTENSIRGLIKSDRDSRDYHRRGIPGHKPILKEIENFTQNNTDFDNFRKYFEYRFSELKRQAYFWEKSWRERIADAGINGPIWRKIPWAIRVLCPFTYVFIKKIMKKS